MSKGLEHILGFSPSMIIFLSLFLRISFVCPSTIGTWMGAVARHPCSLQDRSR